MIISEERDIFRLRLQNPELLLSGEAIAELHKEIMEAVPDGERDYNPLHHEWSVKNEYAGTVQKIASAWMDKHFRSRRKS